VIAFAVIGTLVLLALGLLAWRAMPLALEQPCAFETHDLRNNFPAAMLGDGKARLVSAGPVVGAKEGAGQSA